MKILKSKVLSGPNIWSIRKHNLIEMLVDLEEFEERPTNTIPQFYERLVSLIPGLYRHRCSEDTEGGFFMRVKEGTWLGHVMEHIALELQSMADMESGFGRTRQSHKHGVYHVVYSYQDAEAGIYAGEAALGIIKSIVNCESIDISGMLCDLKNIWYRNKLGPSTESIVREAQSRNIPAIRLDDSYIQLGYGKYQQRIEATIACNTSSIAVDLVGDKSRTKSILSNAHIPVPEGRVISNFCEVQDMMNSGDFPVVIKPLVGNHGRGVTTNIVTVDEAKAAFNRAKAICNDVILERYIVGYDFRILVVNNKFVAAARRTPASVTGDGRSSIEQLIQAENQNHLRGKAHENILTCIEVDDVTRDLLLKGGYSLTSIPAIGETVPLKPTANLSTGGTAEDVTDEVHPSNIALFERTARILGLNICGIDVVAKNLSQPIANSGGAILEVNAAPGFRMHLQPSYGKPRNVARHVVDMLFPTEAPSRIPIIAVTGTNGKTTTTRLISHIIKQAGFYTGTTTTDGIYIGDELIQKGDCSGPSSARVVLQDPAVECAVLECARGGILRNGLGFDTCEVAVVTNVGADHLGLQGINTLEQLARVKSVVPESVKSSGVAVLNADDDLVYDMRRHLNCSVALFSMDPKSARIEAHCKNGGLAAVYKDESVWLLNGERGCSIERVGNIPITFNGTAAFNVANALAATLCCVSQRIPVSAIKKGLRTFIPGPHLTPGRLNLYDFGQFKLLLDYAHNPHGLQAVGKFISSIPCSRKIGIIAGVGDRRDEDLVELGRESSRIFDELIIRHDDDLRGRSSDEINRLITIGVHHENKNRPIHYRSSEQDALEYGLSLMDDNALLVFLVDNVFASIAMVEDKLQQEKHKWSKFAIAV
jgi:cyanophycin synthetase